jgi:UDP-GlcNAc:undecaprenyl-phosphate GlcNAc-1-phosphate transferase
MMNGIGLNRTPFPVANAVLTFLWIAGVSSAFNAIDNSDGLAGSICVISAAALFFMGWSTWQLSFSFLAMALAGGVLGFLHFNMKPARIYMGDTGSFYLGYILAVLVIFGDWSESGVRSFLGGCFVLAVPIYDLGLTTVLRARHGVISGLLSAIAHSDRDHISHRLLKMGMSHGQMIRTLCLLSFGCCCVALVVAKAPGPVAAGVVVIAVAGLTGFGYHLDRRTSVPELWLNPPSKLIKKERTPA